MKKSLISAVKKLLAKLGAEEIEGNNLVEVIDSGADAIEGGGGSGDGNSIVVYTAEKINSSVTVSASYSEILNDIIDGKTVMIRITITDGGGTYKHNCTLASWSSTVLVFTAVYYNMGNWYLESLSIPKDGGMYGNPTFTSKSIS